MIQKIQHEISEIFECLAKESLVRLPIVMGLYGLSKSSIYREIKDGNIPSLITLTSRISARIVDDIRNNLRSKTND